MGKEVGRYVGILFRQEEAMTFLPYLTPHEEVPGHCICVSSTHEVIVMHALH